MFQFMVFTLQVVCLRNVEETIVSWCHQVKRKSMLGLLFWRCEFKAVLNWLNWVHFQSTWTDNCWFFYRVLCGCDQFFGWFNDMLHAFRHFFTLKNIIIYILINFSFFCSSLGFEISNSPRKRWIDICTWCQVWKSWRLCFILKVKSRFPEVRWWNLKLTFFAALHRRWSLLTLSELENTHFFLRVVFNFHQTCWNIILKWLVHIIALEFIPNILLSLFSCVIVLLWQWFETFCTSLCRLLFE